MLKNRIIPCLDVKNGRVVKGINFVDLKDAGDPVEQAKIYSDGGADEICFLDITASNENRDTIYEVVERTSKKCFVPLTVGGGVRMNTGCFGEDMSKILVSVQVMDSNGRVKIIHASDIKFFYRGSDLDNSLIFISESFKGTNQSNTNIQKKINNLV